MHGPLPKPQSVFAGVSGREMGVAAAILLLVALAARLITFGNPVIGYDEQYYLLVGDRMLQGALPYVDLFDRKPIGLFLIYALARLLGGSGFVAYKLMALGFTVATAFGVYRMARRWSGPFGAIAAACILILWYDFMGGEGGQSPVFYNALMLAAAALVLRAIDRPRDTAWIGCAAMLCVGLALQVKYSVVFEGLFFGVALMLVAAHHGRSWRAALGWAPLWAGCALAPTALVLAVYAGMGHGSALLSTNFASVFAQGRNPIDVQLRDLAEILAILAPLFLILAVGRAKGMIPQLGGASLFLWGWLGASLFGVIAFWRFNSPHYALPVLLPLAVLLAAMFDARPWRPRVTLGLIGIAFVMTQVVLADHEARRGGAAQVARLAEAAKGGGAGCIFVYAGYPALYMLTGSCLPTRWAFPGSLNMKDESKAAAIGIDPAVEVARILAMRPPAIVDEYPASRFGNPATRTLVEAALARDYRLAECVALPGGRAQLVYRLRSMAGRAAAPCVGGVRAADRLAAKRSAPLRASDSIP